MPNEVVRKKFDSEKEMLDYMLPLMPKLDNWAMSKTSQDFVAMYLENNTCNSQVIVHTRLGSDPAGSKQDQKSDPL